jgi:hypothetical protein
MTRCSLLLTVAAALAAAACSAPEPPEAAATPVPTATPVPAAVFVQVADEAGDGAQEWAEALQAAIQAGPGLVVAPTPEEATVRVRIDQVETGVEASPEPEGEGAINRMRGALIVGDSAREFSLVYRGDAGPQAEALARNLSRFTTEGGAAATPDTTGTSPGGPPEADDEG